MKLKVLALLSIFRYMFNKVDSVVLDKLEIATCKAAVLTDEETLEIFSKDETEDLRFPPEVVIKPSNVNEISKIVKIANEHLIPIVPRGGGTGLSGGALAVHGGICISMEKLNKILEIDEENFQAVVEPGVITQVFQEECEKRDLFYPPDPASRGSCFLGGNLAECSGGPRAAKYGVTRDYVLGIEFVTPTGEVISNRARVLKNVSGYNLSQLIIGSEGTLGIITKIIFKLLKLPKYKKILLIAFDSVDSCISSVAELYRRGANPSAMEFLEKSAISITEKHLEKKFPNSDAEAQLIVEIDGNREESLESEMDIISKVVEDYGSVDILLAEDRSKMEEVWEMRRSIGEAVKSVSEYKEEDTVVPRAKMPDLLKGVKEISSCYNITTICYGHAGDGNVHVNILKDKTDDENWNKNLDTAIREIFKLTVSLNGTISGEHGIGYSQKSYLPIALRKEEIELMRSLKRSFDPNGIMNPGKIFE
jgi:glycolate oxidase